MKRFYILTITVFACLWAQAQDTLLITGRVPSYFQYNEWDRVSDVDWWETCDTILFRGSYDGTFSHGHGGDIPQMFYTPDTLTIYGVAGAVLPYMIHGNPETAIPVPNEELMKYQEALRLYAFDGVPYQIGEDLIVSSDTGSFTYYALLDKVMYFDSNKPFQVYERFFAQPQKVCDTFFVGCTQHTRNEEREGIDCERQITVMTMTPMKYIDSVWYDYKYYNWYVDGGYEWRRTEHPVVCVFNEKFLYPILTPNPNASPDDTTSGEVGIDKPTVAGRYVHLLPNPAAEQVQITSSFGLGGVEVYNLMGEKVLEQLATGFITIIDVSTLPESSYVVRVSTPAGITSKKLIVQRK